MARRGVWQLQKLTVTYCNFSGSSRGAREFAEEVLPQFKADNPQLAVEEAIRRGRHPYLTADYLNGSSRVVDVKNKTPGEILRHSVFLRSSAGRKTAHPVKNRHITNQSSVQGAWKPTTDLEQQLDFANRQRRRTAAQ